MPFAKRQKKALYICNFNQCLQSNRLLCKKCGKNSHSVDDDSDDDNDIEIEGKISNDVPFHEFDINASYIRKINTTLQLSDKDKNAIQVHVYIYIREFFQN